MNERLFIVNKHLNQILIHTLKNIFFLYNQKHKNH